MKRILIAFSILFLLATTAIAAPPPFAFSVNPALLLPTGCTNGYTATYNSTTNRWDCTAMSGAGDLKADGTVPLTAHWDVGAYNITAASFIGALTGNASTASALAANPTDCAAGELATGIAANGNLTCSATPSLTALTIAGANSLGLGTAGSAVGSVNFKNATTGSITVQPITGALGTPTLVLGTTYTDAKWCSYATATGFTCNETIPMAASKIGTVTNTKYCLGDGSGNIQCTTDPPAGTGDFKADGTVAMTGIMPANAGLNVKNGSTSAGFVDIYEDSDDGTNYHRLTTPALAGNVTTYLPNAAGATGGLWYFSGAGQLANLAAGSEGYILKMGAAVPEWSNTLSVSSISSGGIVLGDTTPDADGEIGYASNAYLWYANSEDWKITASANLWTFDSNTSATFAFTPAVAFTGGIGSIGAASNLSGGTVTLGTLAGSIDAGGATSLEIPNGSSPTVDAAGEIAIDTTSDQLVYYGGAKRVIPYKKFFSTVIAAPADTDDINLLKAPYSMTILAINCIVQGTTSVTGQLQECASDGTSCADLDSDITCDADGAADDGTLTDSAIAANGWLRWKTTSVSGTPTFLTVTVTYSVVSD